MTPLPPVGGTTAPATPAARPSAAAKDPGEGFERMLLGQLTKTLIDSALGGETAGSASSTAYRDLLPDALTEALMSGGGIGLAALLAEAGGGTAR
jgi:Rod binding domain-containing protein